jgi:hypothetical protein
MSAPRSNKLAKIKTDPKSLTDRIREVSPRYAALLEKHSQLRAREEELIAEIKPLGEQQRRSQIGFVAQLPKPKPRPAVVPHAGAAALLGGLLPEPTLEEVATPPVRQSWAGEQRLAELGAESESVAEAIKLIQPALSAARREYSKLVAAQRGEEYTAIVETIVDAANAFSETLLQHHVFINDRREDAVAWQYFRPIDVTTHFGDLAEDFSPLRRLVLAAIEQRHVGAGKLKSVKMPIDVAYLQEGS